MPNSFELFERIARNAHRFDEREDAVAAQLHPFDRAEYPPFATFES
jgi:hypothetical protein